MFSRTSTSRSTSACSGELDALRQKLAEADAVLIGAGAGLSAAAGFAYSGERSGGTSAILPRNITLRICTPGLLRLRQPGRGVLPARACGALGLHQRGHRGRFGTVVNVKTAGGWGALRRFCCVMRLFWLLLGARCARSISAGCASAAGQSAALPRAGRRPRSWLRLPGLKDRPAAEISGQHRDAVQRLGRDGEGVLPEDHEVGQVAGGDAALAVSSKLARAPAMV